MCCAIALPISQRIDFPYNQILFLYYLAPVTVLRRLNVPIIPIFFSLLHVLILIGLFCILAAAYD